MDADKQLAQIGKRLFKEVARPRAEEAEAPRSTGAKKGASRRAKPQAKSSGRSRSKAVGRSSHRLSRVLTDPEEIRQWAEERGAQPAHVKGTGSREDIGMIRLDFPGWGSDEKLQPIDWDEWFEKFEDRGLALIVEDETASGQKSNFNKLVTRATAEGAQGRGGRTRSAR
jgi:hypothetical protein